MTDLRNLCESLARLCNATQDELIGVVYETLADLGRVAVPEKPDRVLVRRVKGRLWRERGMHRTSAGYRTPRTMAENYRHRTSHRTERVDTPDPPDTSPVLGLESLPGRSGDVARMMAMGMTRPQMALALGVAVSEIQWTIASLRKTGARRVRLG